MTIFETIKNKSIDEYVEWLSVSCCNFDSAPWWNWWDDNYCKKCEPEIVYVESLTKDIDSDKKMECGWCELNGKCKFFKEMDEIPDVKQIIKMWLMSEC